MSSREGNPLIDFYCLEKCKIMKPRIRYVAGYWQITQACSIEDIEVCKKCIKALNKEKTQQELCNNYYAERQLRGFLNSVERQSIFALVGRNFW